MVKKVKIEVTILVPFFEWNYDNPLKYFCDHTSLFYENARILEIKEEDEKIW